MKIVLRAIGTANPRRYGTQQEFYDWLTRHFPMTPDEQDLYRKVLLEGPIEGRYYGVDFDEQGVQVTPDALIARFQKHGTLIAVQAANNALQDAGLSPQDLGGLVVNTCTGYLCPGLTSYVSEQLGLAPSTRIFDLMGMGCGAAIPNLECAAGMLARDGARPVMSIAVEICSATLYMGSDPDLVISNSIFGDGAAAAILDTDGTGRAPHMEYGGHDAAFDERWHGTSMSEGHVPEQHARRSAPGYPRQRVMPPVQSGVDATTHHKPLGVPPRARSSSLVPPPLATIIDFETGLYPRHREDLRYRTENGRLRNVLSKRVPLIGAKVARDTACRLLARHGLRPEQIDFWAVHPGGTVVLEQIGEKMGLSTDQLRFSYDIFRQYGNMSSPSVLFVLKKLLAEAKPAKSQRGLMLAFGAGFSAYAALIEF